MRRDELGDLAAFLAVAEARSFTKAAGKLGTSQSALSHTVRRLEARLGLRLLTRTTRSVAPTEAGDRLVATLHPAFEEIDAKLAALTELREKPAGNLRITTSDHAARTILWPALDLLLADYPDVNVEVTLDQGFVDIVAERYDAGIRLGEQVDKDMIAVPISPPMRMAVFGSPAYLADNPAPETPHDLTHHRCINLRLPTLGGYYAWEFGRDGHELRVRVSGQVATNDTATIIMAARAGHGFGCLLEDQIRDDVDAGRLVRVLEDWCPPFPGYHLYYPNRRQSSPAFALLVDALRYRASATG